MQVANAISGMSRVMTFVDGLKLTFTLVKFHLNITVDYVNYVQHNSKMVISTSIQLMSFKYMKCVNLHLACRVYSIAKACLLAAFSNPCKGSLTCTMKDSSMQPLDDVFTYVDGL